MYGISLLFFVSAWYSVDRLSLHLFNLPRASSKCQLRLTSPGVCRPVIPWASLAVVQGPFSEAPQPAEVGGGSPLHGQETSPLAAVISSSLLRVCRVLVEGLLGPLKRADGGALVVSDATLGLCPERDEPLNCGVPEGHWACLSSFLQGAFCRCRVLFGCRWYRWPGCLLKTCSAGQGG